MNHAKTLKAIYKWSLNVDHLYWFCGIWSIIQFSMCIMEFVHLDKFTVPSTMPVAYFLLILIYVLKKNVDRWFEVNWKKRKGERFLVSWWLAMLAMYVIEYITHGRYHVPAKMTETCILLLLPYATNAISKIMHKRYCSARHNKRVANAHKLERIQARST